MKTLFAALLLALSGTASAASVAMKPPVGITGNPASATGWTTASNFVGNFSAASFSGGFTTNVAGKPVTMPATMRMAANAGRFAVSAVRTSPAALLGSAVVAWLLSNGIEYIDGQFTVKQPDTAPIEGKYWYHGIASRPICYSLDGKCSGEQALQDIRPYVCQAWMNPCTVSWGAPFYDTGYRVNVVYTHTSNGQQYTIDNTIIYFGGAAVPATKPATDADFQPLESAPLPDAVADELAPKGVQLPMENPQFDPPYVDLPLGDPYEDPTTGKRYRDNARVTPQSDGKTADVQTNKQEVDEEGEPVTDPATGVEKPPEKQDDFCKQNPNSLACMEKGEPDELDLETRSIGSMVSPVAVGGAGHCMADKTLAMATMGRSITFTYKPICDLASMVRPLILALAWLLAGWIMIGAVKEN